MLVKCICTNCAGHLEFEEENAGEKIDCPHCRFETTLFLPGTEAFPSFVEPKGKFSRLMRNRWVRVAAGVVVLSGFGYWLRRWVLPSLKEWLSDAGSSLSPTVVLAFGGLVILLLLTWLVFPAFLLLRLRIISQTLARMEAGMRQFPAAEALAETTVPPGDAAGAADVEETAGPRAVE